MLSEISQTEDDNAARFHLLVESKIRNKQLTDTENRLVVARGERWMKWVKGIKRRVPPGAK